MRESGDLLRLLLAGSVPNLAYAGLGLLLLRVAAPRLRGAEALATAYLLGTGAASLAILGLRLLDVPVPLWACAALALATLPAARRVLRAPQRTLVERGVLRAPQGPPAARWVRAVDVATVAVGGVGFLAALAPETFWDGFEYHLPMVVAWCEGPIRALPGVLDAETRAGVDLLYVPAVTAGEPDAAASVSACFAACLAVLIRAELRRRATPGAASLAAFFALTVPFTLENAPSSYVDLGVGAYGFLALLSADRWNREGRACDLRLAALALGFAANAKLHAAALAPAVLALVCLGGRPIAPAMALRGAALVAALCAPWLGKAALTSGNPLFPLLGGWLGTGDASPAHLALRRFRLSTDFAARGPLSFGHYLVSIFFGRNPHLSGLIGPLPLALLPAAVSRPRRSTAVLAALLFLLFGLQFVFMPALRFGSPLLPFLAIGAGVGGARLARAGRAPRVAVAGVIALLAVHHVAGVAARYGPRLAALRAPDAYRAREFPEQVGLAELVAQGRGVVAIPKGAVLWMPRPVYLLHWERNGELFFDPVLGRLTPPDEALALLRRRGVGSLVVQVRRPPPTPQTTGHPTVDAWIAAGQARRRTDVPPRPATGGGLYVLVDLLDAG